MGPSSSASFSTGSPWPAATGSWAARGRRASRAGGGASPLGRPAWSPPGPPGSWPPAPRVPAGPAPPAAPGVRIAAYDEAQPGLRRFFTQLTSYLGLVGLASLLVGGIGVAASVSAFIARQVPTIAALKALGAETRTLIATYVIQTQIVA